jgi:hypothetical protein
MTQELIDLRNSILEERYQDALEIVNELESMSKEDKLNKIKSFLVRLMIHLIKNQVEQRLTNSWVASISDSIVQIQSVNIKDNKKSNYVKSGEWENLLVKALAAAIRPTSVEVRGGKLRPSQLSEILDKTQLIQTAEQLLSLSYEYPEETLPDIIDTYLAQLPGGEDWLLGRD